MTEDRLSLEKTIKLVEKLERYHKHVAEKEHGNFWAQVWEANKTILAMLREPEPDATAIREFIESRKPYPGFRTFGGSGWYEVRVTIWRWEGSDRGEHP